ncbi:MAG TPA: hypothetical protein VIZ18_19035, partial [Ktedonobacteraceae bacterium]
MTTMQQALTQGISRLTQTPDIIERERDQGAGQQQNQGGGKPRPYPTCEDDTAEQTIVQGRG